MPLEAGLIFYIKQIISGYFIHPSMPWQGLTHLVVRSGDLGEKTLQFRFIPVNGEGSFGYLEHVETGRVVQPVCGTDPPENHRTKLHLHSKRHSGALFTYDALKNAIQHISGYYIDLNPLDIRSDLEILSTIEGRPGSEFKFVGTHNQEVYPCPTPELSGNWKMINCILNPAAYHIYTFSYTTGRSQTQSSTSQHGWGISAEVSTEWFSASAEYSGFVKKTTEDTWNEEKTVERMISVKPGQSIVTWQWVFRATQDSDSLQFNSNILVDTNSLEELPMPEGFQPEHGGTEVLIDINFAGFKMLKGGYPGSYITNY